MSSINGASDINMWGKPLQLIQLLWGEYAISIIAAVGDADKAKVLIYGCIFEHHENRCHPGFAHFTPIQSQICEVLHVRDAFQKRSVSDSGPGQIQGVKTL